MRYISLFTGAGGLEAAERTPDLCCEIDQACWPILQRRFPGVTLHPDVTTLEPPDTDVVVGGWPCQDISVAGLRRGLAGKRSGLFFELLRVARQSGAHTVVAENVPNLLTLERGQVFEGVLEAFAKEGYRHVGWRLLNSRAFGLPHVRRRLFIVASKEDLYPRALHRSIPSVAEQRRGSAEQVAGFYWTAGLQSICYSVGFVPTLKVGSSLSIPSPPALHFGRTVRKASTDECLLFQGFKPDDFVGARPADVYRIAGNAVSVPVGEFVMATLQEEVAPEPSISRMFAIGSSGLFRDGTAYEVAHDQVPLASNLADFVDLKDESGLSPRAAAGLLSRLVRSQKPCPPALIADLQRLAGDAVPDESSVPSPEEIQKRDVMRAGRLAEPALPGIG